MTIRESVEKEVLYCVLEGELDLHTAPAARSRLDARIEETGARRLVFDFRRVSFIDSSGVGLILGRYRKIKERDGQVEILAPGAAVQKVLAMSGVANLIPIRPGPAKEEES